MGCSTLWKCLSEAGKVESLKGSTRGDYEKIAKEIDGKVVAVDFSVWMFEVKSIHSLYHSMPSKQGAVIKVLFEKISTMLRMGCTPLLVLEGEADPAKFDLLDKRYRAGYAKKQKVKAKARSKFKEIKKFAEALGIATVQAPGEGEAMCAALNSRGLVDACVTKDADVLAFGAQTVYKTFKLSVPSFQPDLPESLLLQSSAIRTNELEICRMSEARSLFGIYAGGTMAMRMVLLLSGGDYNLGGTQKVGGVNGLRAIQGLLENKFVPPSPQLSSSESSRQDDETLVDDFWRGLFALDAPKEQNPIKSCSGCRTCGIQTSSVGPAERDPGAGCPSGSAKRIDRHGEDGCPSCGTHSAVEGGSGEGGCVPMEAGEQCCCPHCLWKNGEGGNRQAMGKVFDRARRQSVNHTRLSGALDTYDRQIRLAEDKARDFADKSDFAWRHRPDSESLLELLEKHLGLEEEAAREKILPLLLEWDVSHRNSSDTEFVVEKVLKVGTKGRQLANQSSQIIVQIKRREGTNPRMEEIDKNWMQSKAGGRWGFRKSAIDRNYADLLRLFKGSEKSGNIEEKCHKITDFFSKKASSPAGPPPEQPQEAESSEPESTPSGGDASPDVDTDSTAERIRKKIAMPAKMPKDVSPERDAQHFSRRRGLRRRVFRRLEYDDEGADVRARVAAAKRKAEESPKRSSPNSAGSKIGSIPRRLSSLSLFNLDRADGEEADRNEDAMDRAPSVDPKSEEVIDLLTPRATSPADLRSQRSGNEDAPIDLLSDASCPLD